MSMLEFLVECRFIEYNCVIPDQNNWKKNLDELLNISLSLLGQINIKREIFSAYGT